MDLNNFYTGFGILLVYFTLVWQNIRQDNKTQIEYSEQLINKSGSLASREQINNQLESLKAGIFNPLNITISIISISGAIAFYKIIFDNLNHISSNVESVVLISIALMHLVISVDLWNINIKICHRIIKVSKLKSV